MPPTRLDYHHQLTELEVMMNTIRLWIDAHEVVAEPAQTIMEAADRADIPIPRLCYHPSLKPSGSCRLCAVEIDGYRGLPAACSTPVANGMVIRTATPKVVEFRREMLRLILQEHPRECLACPRNGTCELQQLIASVGIDFPYPPPTRERPEAKSAGAYFERDSSLCVNCGRCVRVCHEVRGAKAIVFREAEGRQEVITPFERPLEEVGCQFCGACVDVCPVGALREKLDVYQGEGRQHMLEVCEGLADIVLTLYRNEMPRDWKSSLCPICTAGCEMSFELTESGDIVQARPAPGGARNRGQGCVQGRFLLKGYVQGPKRLKKPLIRENGGYREESWDSVLDLLASRLQSCDPWETAILADPRLAVEDLYLLRQFARTVLKTNLIGCVTPQGQAAAMELLNRNSGLSSVRGKLQELSRAGAVLVMGANPSASHPIAGVFLREAVLNGSKLVTANPCAVSIARYADVHLSHYPGSEAVLVAGLIRLLLDENRVDPAWSGRNTQGLHALKEQLAGYDPEAVARLTGVSPEELSEAAHLLGSANTLCVLYGPGLIESPCARESLQALTALLQMTGSIAKPGGGMIPLFGIGNLQGAWDLGLVSQFYETPGDGAHSNAPPVGTIYEMLASGQVKTLYLALESLGDNLFDRVRPFLKNLELVILHDLALPASLNGTTEPPAHVILPTASAMEKGGMFIYADSQRGTIMPVITRPGDAQPAKWVLQELARRMNARSFASQTDETLRDDLRKELASATETVKPQQKARTACCCRQAAGSECSSDNVMNGINWQPPAPPMPQHPVNEELPFAVIRKGALAPYFLGPLLAPEAKGAFCPDGDIEMNPSDVFGMGLAPGEIVRVVTRSGEWEGRVALNSLLSSRVVAVSSQAVLQFDDDIQQTPKVIPARVEKR